MYSILIYNFRMVLTIFKVAISPLIFLTSRPISSLTPIETITDLMCSFWLFLVIYIIQSRLLEMQVFLQIVVGAFSIF